MALYTLDEYFLKNRLPNESYFGFTKRVLVNKFGGVERVFYRKKGKFIHVDAEEEKLLNEIQRKNKGENHEKMS